MAIITVSRELAVLGDETAKALAALLGYRLVEKNAIEERVKSYGIPISTFEKYDEKKPAFWTSLSRDRDDYIHFLKNAILAEAGQGNAILMGRGAALILQGVPAVFSIFLVASREVRIERVKNYFHCDEKRARQIIEKSDHDREGFHRYFFDARWKDSTNYHLVLNTGFLNPDLCAKTVKYSLDKILTEEAEKHGAERIGELSLGQQVRHHILYKKELAIHFLEANVLGDKIFLYGVANAHTLVEAAVSAAKEAAPEYFVQSEIQVVQDYSVMP